MGRRGATGRPRRAGANPPRLVIGTRRGRDRNRRSNLALDSQFNRLAFDEEWDERVSLGWRRYFTLASRRSTSER
jgi:hypothetical protein